MLDIMNEDSLDDIVKPIIEKQYIWPLYEDSTYDIIEIVKKYNNDIEGYNIKHIDYNGYDALQLELQCSNDVYKKVSFELEKQSLYLDLDEEDFDERYKGNQNKLHIMESNIEEHTYRVWYNPYLLEPDEEDYVEITAPNEDEATRRGRSYGYVTAVELVKELNESIPYDSEWVNELVNQLETELQSNNIYSYVDTEEMSRESIKLSIEIDNGDWKHEHRRTDLIVSDVVEDFGSLDLLNLAEETLGDSDSDTYSSIHSYLVTNLLVK